MFEPNLILLIVIGIIGKLCWDAGKRRGCEKQKAEEYNRGYKDGIVQIENEIKECCKLPDNEILKRVKKYRH